jgi:tight adherence protein C
MEAVIIGGVVFVIVGGAAFVAAVLALRVTGVSRDRLTPATSAAPSVLRWEPPSGVFARLAERLGRRAAPKDPLKVSRLRRQLAWAGYHDPRAVTLFVGAKLGVAAGLAVAYPLLGMLQQRALSNVVLVSIVLAGFGFMVPDLWLRRGVRRRRTVIGHALPDLLDLLTICVEAGMALDAALARVVEQPEVKHSALHREIQRMNLEIRMGRPRAEAMRGLAMRCGVQELQALVSVLIQTERLGTSVGKALRVHAETSRVQRRHRAEEQAYIVPVKMLFPTMIFLMPSFILVAMAPSFLSLMQMIKQMGGRP